MLKIWPGMWLSAVGGNAVGNFVWQAFTAGDWKAAGELSFFQAVAVGTLWVAARLTNAKT